MSGAGWAVSVGTALTRWGRRRSVRAQLTAAHPAAVGQERRAELEERLLLEEELQAFRRELERTETLAQLYAGPRIRRRPGSSRP